MNYLPKRYWTDFLYNAAVREDFQKFQRKLIHWLKIWIVRIRVGFFPFDEQSSLKFSYFFLQILYFFIFKPHFSRFDWTPTC